MLALLAGPIKAVLSPQVCQVQQTGLTCDAQTAHPTRFMRTARNNFYLPERPLALSLPQSTLPPNQMFSPTLCLIL